MTGPAPTACGAPTARSTAHKAGGAIDRTDVAVAAERTTGLSNRSADNEGVALVGQGNDHLHIGLALRTKLFAMTGSVPAEWNGATVRLWLERRIVASRSDQAAAERVGRSAEDDCDKATAEEMVCTLLIAKDFVRDQALFASELRALLDRDDYRWRGIYDDTRFDRHVRSYVRKLAKMTKTNEGFDRTGRYQ